MKKSIVITLALLLGILSPAFADTKVGTVDMLKLVRNHASYDQNKTLLTETERDYQKKLDKMKDELASVEEEFKKLSEQLRQPMLAATAKAKIEKDLMEVQSRGLAGQQRLRSEAMRSQQELQNLEARLLKSVKADLDKKIAAFAELNGYDLIIDYTAAPYAKAALNVTDGVLKSMGIDPDKAVNPDAEAADRDGKGKEANEGK